MKSRFWKEPAFSYLHENRKIIAKGKVYTFLFFNEHFFSPEATVFEFPIFLIKQISCTSKRIQ